MPSESSHSSGVEIIHPIHMMNPHHFSEPEWPHPSPLVRSPYQYRDDRAFPPFQIPMDPSDFDSSAYSAPQPHRPPPIQISQTPNHLLPLSRPKSSPSAFGPNVEDLLFNENPFRMKNDEFVPSIFTVSPQPAPPTTRAVSPYYPAPEYPASNQPPSPGRTQPIPIAPDPVGLRNMNALKRMREDEEYFDDGHKKRKRASSQSGPVELNEEEQLLLKLKEEENLPWKDIAVRFQTDLGKSYQVPALQMRFKRLRERMRTWTDTDVQALEQAYDYWERFQFDIIATKVSSLALLILSIRFPGHYCISANFAIATFWRSLEEMRLTVRSSRPQMLDFGASERWPAKSCARKWEELHPGPVPFSAHPNLLRDPWDIAVTASPIPSSIGTHSPRATL
ncbi:MAG: hypothetical protein Q9163_003918 [Psora crenata]